MGLNITNNADYVDRELNERLIDCFEIVNPTEYFRCSFGGMIHKDLIRQYHNSGQANKLYKAITCYSCIHNHHLPLYEYECRNFWNVSFETAKELIDTLGCMICGQPLYLDGVSRPYHMKEENKKHWIALKQIWLENFY